MKEKDYAHNFKGTMLKVLDLAEFYEQRLKVAPLIDLNYVGGFLTALNTILEHVTASDNRIVQREIIEAMK